jgi:hypothetical protein
MTVSIIKSQKIDNKVILKYVHSDAANFSDFLEG